MHHLISHQRPFSKNETNQEQAEESVWKHASDLLWLLVLVDLMDVSVGRREMVFENDSGAGMGDHLVVLVDCIGRHIQKVVGRALLLHTHWKDTLQVVSPSGTVDMPVFVVDP